MINDSIHGAAVYPSTHAPCYSNKEAWGEFFKSGSVSTNKEFGNVDLLLLNSKPLITITSHGMLYLSRDSFTFSARILDEEQKLV